ncbi:hypothetical protein OG271_03895 [Micromonospora rifamycinica]|uniref:hypothetical protein n=1 Tax=Micromonospora rifamycinica TaxID=291594 RepID=UPI002E2CDE53|nr:hypothetical protein [Micromonospora rifamycinica]
MTADRPICGAANTVLRLTCNREPHPPGTAHYQDDGNGIRAWYDPDAVARAAPDPTRSEVR